MSRKFLVFLGFIFLLIVLGNKDRSIKLTAKKTTEAPQTEERSIPAQKVKIFLIALNDDGLKGKKVGCGDSAIAFEKEVSPTKALLKASIDVLLSLPDKTYSDGLLYNSLAGSKLRVDTVSIDENGLVKIELSGSYKFSGVCENARFIAQIEETARQFVTVQEVEIFLNKKSLKNLYKGD